MEGKCSTDAILDCLSRIKCAADELTNPHHSPREIRLAICKWTRLAEKTAKCGKKELENVMSRIGS